MNHNSLASLVPTPESPRRQFLSAGLMLIALAGAAVWTLQGANAGGAAPTLGLTLAAVFFAGVMASIAGFAFSAIAGALIAHLYPDPVEMVRILLVCSITIQAYCTLKILKSVRWHDLAPYLAGGLLTAPLGVFLLTRISTHVYTLVLGAFLVLYGLHSLRKPVTVGARPNGGMDVLVGALGGITGGLAAFPGAFAAIWCSARGLTKESQRAICQPYIFVMQIATLAMLEQVRPSGMDSLSHLWIFVPLSLVAAKLGFGVFQRLTGSQFKLVMLIMLIASGLVLMLRSW